MCAEEVEALVIAEIRVYANAYIISLLVFWVCSRTEPFDLRNACEMDCAR